ncbi:MAG TPA: glycosyltransferase [Rhizomicrobium sp.]|nr:glycosyltransferase [Rhizomicrobium sp.]
MRIAIVATNYAEYAANLALALSASNEVMLVLSRRNARRELRPQSIKFLREKVSLHIVPHHYAPLQPIVAGLCWRLVARFRPDVVHVQEHPTRATYWLARLLKGAHPLVTTVHDPIAHSGADTASASIFARYHRGLRLLSDRIIVHGNSLVSDFSDLLPNGAQRVRSVPHGVLRFGLFKLEPEAAISTEDRFIFFGRMNKYKGLDVLLDANEIWLEKGLRPSLIVAGTGPEIVRLRDRLRLAPNIELLPRWVSQPELEALLRQCAASILPYRDATQSGAAASSLGAGRPVIATNVGALSEVIRAGENGLLVPPGDAQSLADASAKFLSDPELRKHVTEGARRTAGSVLGWTGIASLTEQIYQEAWLAHKAKDSPQPAG